MICPRCSEQDHARCIDIYWGPNLDTGEHSPVVEVVGLASFPEEYFLKPGRAYASCDCQHRRPSATAVTSAPVTGVEAKMARRIS